MAVGARADRDQKKKVIRRMRVQELRNAALAAAKPPVVVASEKPLEAAQPH